ncbi:MAG: MFS transporter [Simplicispira sp.]|uniref:MFS transporter n=1 Tax=Simplicispira sp. TaxID=2015802 RepID=UPI00258BB67D|nr:MFS transporter [Simplicispira sp.]MDD2690201.1 MFS transporter [Simplicispira sp.]
MPSAVTQDTVMLRTIGLAAFASMAAMRVCDPMLVTLSQEFAVTTGDASAVVAAFAVAYGVLQLFYGPLGDRIGKLRVIAAAASGCAVFSAITALAPSLTLLVLARAAMGAAAAGIIPLSMAWIGDQVPYAQRQEALARLMGATVSGMMFGQWFGGFAAQNWGWRSAFAALALLFALAAAGLLRQLRGGQGAAVQVPAPGSAAGTGAATATAAAAPPASALSYVHKTLALLRVPRVRWVLTVTAIEGACAFGTLAFVPSRLIDGFGLSASAAGAVMVLYGVGGLCYSLFARRWLAALGERGLALTGGTLLAAGLLALAWSPWMAGAVAGCFASGLGFYMLHNTLQTQATQMAPEARGTAVTLFACLLFLGQSCGVLAMAASVDRGLLAPMFTLAALGVGVLGVLVSRKLRAWS